jgi:hypothetical protein
MKPKPILKYGGLTLFVIGFLLNVWMFVVKAWPTYLFFVIMAVGGLLFGLSFPLKKLKTFWQIAITLIPFLIGFILFRISDASDDIFLIPKGFRGQVIVLYAQPHGEPKEFDGKWRIYRVPQNGILKTQFKLKGNVIDLERTKYFFIDARGNKRPIKEFCDYCDKKDTSTVQIIYGSVSTDSTGIFQNFFVDIPTDSSK